MGCVLAITAASPAQRQEACSVVKHQKDTGVLLLLPGFGRSYLSRPKPVVPMAKYRQLRADSKMSLNILYLNHSAKKAVYESRSQVKLNDVLMDMFSAKSYFLSYFFPSNGCLSKQSYWDFILHKKK